MHLVDLNHSIEMGMPIFPGTPEIEINNLCTVEKDGFAQKELRILTHVGTHMDAPAHMIRGGKTLDQFLLSKFTGKACLIPFSHDDIAGQDQGEYLCQFEELIRECEFVLLHTSWSEKWGSPEYFKKYPALDISGAKYLTGFHLSGIGIDSISLDLDENASYDVHHEVLGNDMIIIENLCRLDQIRAKTFKFAAFPLLIKEADGSPVRAVAEY